MESDFEALAERYFDEVLAPVLSILTEKDQGKMYERFMGCVEMSTIAKSSLTLWKHEKLTSAAHPLY